MFCILRKHSFLQGSEVKLQKQAEGLPLQCPQNCQLSLEPTHVSPRHPYFLLELTSILHLDTEPSSPLVSPKLVLFSSNPPSTWQPMNLSNLAICSHVLRTKFDYFRWPLRPLMTWCLLLVGPHFSLLPSSWLCTLSTLSFAYLQPLACAVPSTPDTALLCHLPGQLLLILHCSFCMASLWAGFPDPRAW